MRLFLLFLLSFTLLSAEIVQIGNGTLVNQSLPLEAARNYSYSQQIYYASEINYLGYIDSIAFQYSVSGNLFYQNNNILKVYLGHTDRTHLESFVPLDSLTLVYDGVVAQTDFSGSLPGQGWMTLNLLEPFFYDGTGHLLVAVDENAPGSSLTQDEFLCTASPEVRGMVYSDMNVNPDPAAPPDSGSWFRQCFANLRLNMVVYSNTPYEPVPQHQATDVATDTNLQWQGDATSYDLFLGTSEQTMEHLGMNLNQNQWNPPEPLQLLETYYWQVVGHFGGQDYPGQIWSFTTVGEGIGPPRNLTAYYNGEFVQLHWDAPLVGNPVLYRISRNGLFLNTTTGTSYQDAEVLTGQDYYYSVKAENALGEISLPSNTATVHIPGETPNLILEQGFEACDPFSEQIPGWQNLDLDGYPTWQWANVDFPSEGAPHAWLSLFPSQMTPPQYTIPAHSGAAMLASISALTPPNNDWLITPRLNLGANPELTFWARSHTADYGLERLKVLISTSDTTPASFTAINTGNWLAVPVAWTEYSYDLSAWQQQEVYLAWQIVSWDAFALYLDDIAITGEGGSAADDEHAVQLALSIYPNPSQGTFSIANPSRKPFDLHLYDLRGRKLYSGIGLTEFRSSESSLKLVSGIYLLCLESEGKSQHQRLAIIK